VNRKPYKAACVFVIKRNGEVYRYMVRTTVNKERRYIGCFKTREEAEAAYLKFKEKIDAEHGVR
jgi:hypothetical protein